MVYKRSKIKKFSVQFEQEHNRQPTEDEISKALGFSKKVIQNVMDINGVKLNKNIKYKVNAR